MKAWRNSVDNRKKAAPEARYQKKQLEGLGVSGIL